MIEVANLTKRFGATVAVNDISFSVRQASTRSRLELVWSSFVRQWED